MYTGYGWLHLEPNINDHSDENANKQRITNFTTPTKFNFHHIITIFTMYINH